MRLRLFFGKLEQYESGKLHALRTIVSQRILMSQCLICPSSFWPSYPMYVMYPIGSNILCAPVSFDAHTFLWIHNLGHNILALFSNLARVRIATSKTIHDIQYNKLDTRVALRVAERLKTQEIRRYQKNIKFEWRPSLIPSLPSRD